MDLESARVSPGSHAVIADVDGVKVGLTICYDLRFPELYRTLALGGAELGIDHAEQRNQICSLSEFLDEGPVILQRSVAIGADDIAGDYETVFASLRARYGKGILPRTVNLITGPSRSADIEQTLLLGAHGPRRLHIVIVG